MQRRAQVPCFHASRMNPDRGMLSGNTFSSSHVSDSYDQTNNFFRTLPSLVRELHLPTPAFMRAHHVANVVYLRNLICVSREPGRIRPVACGVWLLLRNLQRF